MPINLIEFIQGFYSHPGIVKSIFTEPDSIADLICPVTLEVFLQPIQLPCGHFVEKSTAAALNVCPLCRKYFMSKEKWPIDAEKKQAVDRAIDCDIRLRSMQHTIYGEHPKIFREATAAGDLEMVQLLIVVCVDDVWTNANDVVIDQKQLESLFAPVEKGGLSALELAIRKHQLAVVKFFLDFTDLDLQRFQSERSDGSLLLTALEFANSAEYLELLIAAKVVLTSRTQRQRALQLVITKWFKNVDAYRVIFPQFIENETFPFATALADAAEYNNTEFFKYLLKKVPKFDVNTTTAKNKPPLYYAIVHKNDQMVMELVKRPVLDLICAATRPVLKVVSETADLRKVFETGVDHQQYFDRYTKAVNLSDKLLHATHFLPFDHPLHEKLIDESAAASGAPIDLIKDYWCSLAKQKYPQLRSAWNKFKKKLSPAQLFVLIAKELADQSEESADVEALVFDMFSELSDEGKNSEIFEGFSLFHYAVATDRCRLVRRLIARYQLTLDHPIASGPLLGNTAFHLARSQQMMSLLVSAAATSSSHIDHINNVGLSPIAKAATEGNQFVCEELLRFSEIRLTAPERSHVASAHRAAKGDAVAVLNSPNVLLRYCTQLLAQKRMPEVVGELCCLPRTAAWQIVFDTIFAQVVVQLSPDKAQEFFTHIYSRLVDDLLKANLYTTVLTVYQQLQVSSLKNLFVNSHRDTLLLRTLEIDIVNFKHYVLSHPGQISVRNRGRQSALECSGSRALWDKFVLMAAQPNVDLSFFSRARELCSLNARRVLRVIASANLPKEVSESNRFSAQRNIVIAVLKRYSYEPDNVTHRYAVIVKLLIEQLQQCSDFNSLWQWVYFHYRACAQNSNELGDILEEVLFGLLPTSETQQSIGEGRAAWFSIHAHCSRRRELEPGAETIIQILEIMTAAQASPRARVSSFFSVISRDAESHIQRLEAQARQGYQLCRQLMTHKVISGQQFESEAIQKIYEEQFSKPSAQASPMH